jgi:hypothetical protein
MVSAERARPSRVRWIAALVLLAMVAVGLWFRGGVFGRQYEYEEELTLALDGSATLRVNASIAALLALRGIDVDPAGAVDRDAVRAAYDSPVASVTSVPRPWTRRGRAFVQVNLRVPDIRRLHEAEPFAWSRYEFAEENGHTVFRQTVGRSAFRPGTLPQVGWNGREIVGFRLHLPSRILEHNARDLERHEPTPVGRGNILAWEQHLSDRLDGQPMVIVVRMESQSILYLTLWLFAGAFTSAVLTLVALIWWLARRGRHEPAAR